MSDELSNHYSQDFYDSLRSGSIQSAQVILPIVFEQFGTPTTLLDVGGGEGAWSCVALDLGVQDVRLVDGNHVNPMELLIDKAHFIPRDLSESISIEETFDMVMCLEVVEHLPETRAKSIVKELCALAPMVLFSAAIPGQGGAHHVNEKWLSYWSDLFAQEGAIMVDSVRPIIWNRTEVEWWYRQNTVVFLRTELVNSSLNNRLIDLVHPEAWIAYGNDSRVLDI